MTDGSRASAVACRRVARAGTAGYLLAETLAAFTISAFVLLGLVSAVSVLMRSVDRSVASIESVDDLGRAVAAVAHDVAGLDRARWNGVEPQAFVFRGGANSLFFARVVRNPDGSIATKVISLREIVAGSGTRLVRAEARLSARASSFDDLRYGTPREIWTGAARLRLAYIGQREDHGEPPPRHDWPSGTQLPAAILIQAVDRESRRVLLTERVTIAANADIGCLDTDSETPTSEAPAPNAAADAGPTPAAQGSGGADPGLAPSPTPAATPGAGAASNSDNKFCGRPDAKDEAKAPAAAPTGTPPQPAQGPTL